MTILPGGGAGMSHGPGIGGHVVGPSKSKVRRCVSGNVNQSSTWRGARRPVVSMVLGSDARVDQVPSLPRKWATLKGFKGLCLFSRWSFVFMSLGVSIKSLMGAQGLIIACAKYPCSVFDNHLWFQIQIFTVMLCWSHMKHAQGQS